MKRSRLEMDDLFPEFNKPKSNVMIANSATMKREIDWKNSKLNDDMPLEPKRSKRQEKKKNRTEEAKSKKKWFGVQKVELTADLKNDVEALKYRSALDTKRVYKRNGIQIGQYFQVGRVVEAPEEYYSSRVPKKQRRTIAQEFMESNGPMDDEIKKRKRK